MVERANPVVDLTSGSRLTLKPASGGGRGHLDTLLYVLGLERIIKRLGEVYIIGILAGTCWQ